MTNDTGPSRRQFLGAAAALAALPSTVEATDGGETKVNREAGAANTRLPQRDPVWSSVHLGEWIDEETRLNVAGYWYDSGQDPQVEVKISSDGVSMTLNLSPQRAREFAADLERAATNAEQGDRELTDNSQEASR